MAAWVEILIHLGEWLTAESSTDSSTPDRGQAGNSSTETLIRPSSKSPHPWRHWTVRRGLR